MDPVTRNGIKTQLRVVVGMTDEAFNRLMDNLSGFLFGIGFGMIVGYGLL